MNKIRSIFGWFFKSKLRLGITIVVLIAAGYFFWKSKSAASSAPQYQTASVEKGTLISSISASGTVSSANSTPVSTQASGVVKEISVKNGDQVTAGQTLLTLNLDLEGQARQSSAWSSYLSTKNNLDSAKATYYSLQSDMMTKWKTYMEVAQSGSYQNSDGSPRTDTRALPQFYSTNDDWLYTEAKFKQQGSQVSQAQAAQASSWISYQQSSSTIIAPVAGTVTGLNIQPGNTVTASTNTSGGASSVKIGSIVSDATPLISVSITEIDAPKIKVGQKATVTIEALPDKTFTGSVVSIDTSGVVISGVTTYPTFIKLDTQAPEIYANMSASAAIITATKDEALMVPTSAVQTQNGAITVRVFQNGQLSNIPVTIGIASDSQTEVISGLSEGETVVTGVLSTNTTARTATTSVFSAIGGGRGFGGGAPAARGGGR
jgi:macrolide-specific efflux system membrane fusion protein